MWQDWPRTAQSQGVFPQLQSPVDLPSCSGKSHFPSAWQLGVSQCRAGNAEPLQSAVAPLLNPINLPLGSEAGVKYRMLLVCPGAGQDLLRARLWMHISYLSPEIYGVPEIYSACKTLLNAGLGCAMAIVWECFVSAGRKTGTALPERLPGGKRHGRDVRSQMLLPEGWRGAGMCQHPILVLPRRDAGNGGVQGKGKARRGRGNGENPGPVVLGLHLHPSLLLLEGTLGRGDTEPERPKNGEFCGKGMEAVRGW